MLLLIDVYWVINLLIKNIIHMYVDLSYTSLFKY